MFEMKIISAEITMKNLRKLFATIIIQKEIVSDNGPQFTSEEFAKICKPKGIVHKKNLHITLPQMKQRKSVKSFKMGFKNIV